jgi:purine-binding chemotaxis protein CheW
MSRRAIASGDELQFLVFRLGDRECALDISQAERILRYEAPAALAGGPAFVEGVIPFAGQQVPLMDLRRRIGIEPGFGEETRVVVLALEGCPLAIVVDQVTEVARIDTRTILKSGEPVPGLPPECLGGTIPRRGRNIVILNAARFLSNAERLALSEART